MTHVYTPPTDLDPAARAVIRRLKRSLVLPGRRPQPADRDNLAQDLALHAHLAAGRYDPARGAKGTFYDRVLRNRVRSIRARALCQKRDCRRERSLNGGDPAVKGVCYLADQVDLAIDVRDAMDALTTADREVAWLLATDSVAGVARHTNSTRGTIRGAKARIAKALAAKNLAPNSRVEQPIRAGNRYVLSDGTDHHLNSRPTGRKAKVVGVRSPGCGKRQALPAAAEGAP